MFVFFILLSFAILNYIQTENTHKKISLFESTEFLCSPLTTNFVFTYDSKESFPDQEFLPPLFTLSIKYRSNSLNSAELNNYFDLNMYLLYGTDAKLNVPKDKINKTIDNNDGIIDYRIVGNQGIYFFNFTCLQKFNNYMEFYFVPGIVNLKDSEFDSGFTFINVGGFFQGTYKQYFDFKVFMIDNDFNLNNIIIKFESCLGTGEIAVFNSSDFFNLVQRKSIFKERRIQLNKQNINLVNLNLYQKLNFIVVFADSGVNYMWNSPSQLLIRIKTQFNMPKILPNINQTYNNYSFEYPIVNINFTRIGYVDNEIEDNSYIQNRFIKYEFFLTKDNLFLELVSKCGLDIAMKIEKKGIFNNMNNDFLSVYSYQDQNLTLLSKNLSRVLEDLKDNNSFTDVNNNTNNFLNDTSNITNFEITKPIFSIIDNQLTVNFTLPEKDYYFMILKATLYENKSNNFDNLGSYNWETIFIKVGKQTNETLADYAIILIAISVLIFVVICSGAVFKIVKHYLKNTPKTPKEQKSTSNQVKKNKKKPLDKQSLFVPNNESVNIKLNNDLNNTSIINPSEINISKVL